MTKKLSTLVTLTLLKFWEKTVILKLTSRKTLAFNEVLHVPNIRENLGFVAILRKVGVEVSFEFDKIVMTKNNVFVGKGFCNQGCWNYGSLTIEMVAHYWNGGSLLKWWLTIEMVAIIFLYKLISSSFVIIPSHTSLSKRERERRVKEES